MLDLVEEPVLQQDQEPAHQLFTIGSVVNSSAQRLQALWISFIFFVAYLTIAVLGTTHRTLFLEAPIKLPVFNVDLPLQSFYAIAPGLFLIFHFYLLVQLVLLSRNVAEFNAALDRCLPNALERELFRVRLDNSPFVQRLAGMGALRATEAKPIELSKE